MKIKVELWRKEKTRKHEMLNSTTHLKFFSSFLTMLEAVTAPQNQAKVPNMTCHLCQNSDRSTMSSKRDFDLDVKPFAFEVGL